MEWDEYQASLCRCGRPRNESFNPDNEERYDSNPLRCHACSARDRAQRNVATNERADLAGMYFTVEDTRGG